MVFAPQGVFDMGSRREDAAREGLSEERAARERPQHRVVVQAFWIGASEVTLDQFAAFVVATSHRTHASCTTFDSVHRVFAASPASNWRNPGFAQTGAHPVVCVDWSDAKAYADWLRAKTGKNYRLPTEAEWEYVARASTQGPRYWGDTRADACRYANVADTTYSEARNDGLRMADRFPCTDGYTFTAPVGRFKPNAFSVYDAIGNVWEWTEDCFSGSYQGAPASGVVWLSGDCSRRIARGGSWTSPARHVTVTFRDPNPTTYRSSYLGFRLARDQ